MPKKKMQVHNMKTKRNPVVSEPARPLGLSQCSRTAASKHGLNVTASNSRRTLPGVTRALLVRLWRLLLERSRLALRHNSRSSALAHSHMQPFGIHWRDCEGGIESFGIVQIDGNVIGGRGLNGVPGRAVAKTTLPMEVQMVTFRDYSAPLADARHSVSGPAHVLCLGGALTCAQRSNSTSSIMTEADELAQTPVLNVYTPWTRL